MRESRDWAPPPSSRSRDRSSSQIDTPRSLSWARFLVIGPPVSRARQRTAARPGRLLGKVAGAARGGLLGRAGGVVPAGGGDRLTCLGDGCLRGDPELLVQALVGGRGTVVLQAHRPAGVTDELVPALGDPGLDGDPGPDAGRQDGLAVVVVLQGEPLLG